jgi:beta-galactosidase/beta-glucuronidase
MYSGDSSYTFWKTQGKEIRNPMQYRLQDRYYSDFDIIDVNRLTGRSYFIPYPSREDLTGIPLTEKRYRSPLVKCLNGNWDFNYYDDPNDLPLEFDSDELTFGTIDVPSVWQYRGYSHPMYLNVRYPFPYKPPVIPTLEPVKRYYSLLDGFKTAPADEMNHVGLYRTFFDVEDTSKRHILSFLGVCSCVEVHVNGQFAGFSEESHNTAEFDITSIVEEGRNELVCVVRRWCNGTYLECQDMFRNNGIFRDVLLRISDKKDIWDIDVKTRANGNTYSADLAAYVPDGVEVKFTLEGKASDGKELKVTGKAVSTDGVAKATFADLSVSQWSAEDPQLYDLYIESPYSCIRQRIGFKEIEVRGNLYLLNGHKIKFKGVNHHDTDPKNGYCMTPAEIERDLRLCKEFNIDTVRTSHYAPDPLLIELSAEMGIYIVDEVDIETHGVFVARLPMTYNRISNDSNWMKRYLSRTIHHYQRDKALATPIIMWSLGNESGGGCNTDATYGYFKSVSDIPVQYESAIYTNRKAYDIASRMYPPVRELHEIGEGTCRTKQFMDRPYFMCEYAHAMGVGPGNIEGYWKEIYSYDGLIGGCVWEMNDHAVEHEDGSYTYGGDHGEWIHDGNFCCDGIFYPDRTPSTGAWIVRHAYRPIRLSRIEGNRFEVFNTTAFTEGSAFLMKIGISNGRSFEFVPGAKPLKKEQVEFDLGDVSGDCFLNADTYDRTGRLVSTEQICLNREILRDVRKTESLPSWFRVEDGNPRIDLGSTTMSPSEPYTILFRAETDNDSIDFKEKPMRDWYGGKTTMLGCRQTEDRAVTEWAIEIQKKTFLCTDVYEGCTLPDGSEGVLVSSLIHSLKVKAKLPRFGKAFRLDPSFDDVTYKGRCGESYVDMKEQYPVRECSCKVEDMTEPNLKPQESGNRCDTRYVRISDGKAAVRFTAVDNPFELSVKPYSDTELVEMKHREDEHKTGTYVTINRFQQGIGTGSCGPYTLDEHCYDASEDHILRFIISREFVK